MMISLARAGPTSRTKRVVDATPSGTPRSTSGIQSWASAPASLSRQAGVSPQPPPPAWPLMAAIVVCSRFSSSVLARSNRRRNWLLRPAKAWRFSSSDIELLSPASAPAENTGGAPVTITTRVEVSSRSSVKAAARSMSMGSLSALRRSGRFMVTVAMAPSRWRLTFSAMRGWYGIPVFDTSLVLGGREFTSRLIVGTGKFSSHDAMREALDESGAEIVVVAVRRLTVPGTGDSLLDHVDTKRYTIVPSTAGSYTGDEAIRTAYLAREAGLGDMIKLDITGDPRTLFPDVEALIGTTRTLARDGFTVLPYMSDDPLVARRLQDSGAAA